MKKPKRWVKDTEIFPSEKLLRASYKKLRRKMQFPSLMCSNLVVSTNNQEHEFIKMLFSGFKSRTSLKSAFAVRHELSLRR